MPSVDRLIAPGVVHVPQGEKALAVDGVIAGFGFLAEGGVGYGPEICHLRALRRRQVFPGDDQHRGARGDEPRGLPVHAVLMLDIAALQKHPLSGAPEGHGPARSGQAALQLQLHPVAALPDVFRAEDFPALAPQIDEAVQGDAGVISAADRGPAQMRRGLHIPPVGLDPLDIEGKAQGVRGRHGGKAVGIGDAGVQHPHRRPQLPRVHVDHSPSPSSAASLPVSDSDTAAACAVSAAIRQRFCS